MLDAALKFLYERFGEASKPVKLDVSDPRQVHYLYNGVDHGFALPVPPRDHAVATLDDLIALAKRFAGEGKVAIEPAEGEAADPPDVVVWYDEDRVVLVIDDAGHRVERATFALDKSEVFRTIIELRNAQWLPHADFCRLLRVALKPALAPADLLSAVKAITFENGSIVAASSDRGTESIGRSIKVMVHEVAKIPEDVALYARVYRNPGETTEYRVACAVEIKPEHGALRLVPLPDAVEEAVEQAVTGIGRRLVDALGEDVPCYRGAP